VRYGKPQKAFYWRFCPPVGLEYPENLRSKEYFLLEVLKTPK